MTCHGWRHLLITGTLCGLLAGCRTAERFAAPSAEPPPCVTPTHDAAKPVSVRESPPPPVIAASYSQSSEELPPPAVAVADPEQVEPGTNGPAPLPLQDVIVSVQQSYPLLITAFLERQIADGKQLAAWGEFDLGLKAFGIAQPEGFYKNYRNGFSLDQPLFGGGYLYGGYKIGNGKFQPWYKERQTNEGGEFSLGLGTPLLKDRTIDKRRAAVFQAELARQAVEPAVRAQLLEFVRIASQVYWSWVAAGQTLEAQRELLRNAEARVRQIQERVAAGDLERIARINNEQLIASRETKVIESDRKLQESAIKLSLFFRDGAGAPLIPDPSRLPAAFPDSRPPGSDQIQADIARALRASPELVELDLQAEQVCVELQNAENMLLPKLDARLLASKDVGSPPTITRDKTPFELEAGLYGELPLQRREARGKVAAAQGKLAQIDAKRRFVTDKIAAAVQDAVSALQAAAGRIDRATTNLDLARQTLQLGRLQFDAGDIDLVTLNIYEQAVTDAQVLLISAQADYFAALADYRAALALDPLAAE